MAKTQPGQRLSTTTSDVAETNGEVTMFRRLGNGLVRVDDGDEVGAALGQQIEAAEGLRLTKTASPGWRSIQARNHERGGERKALGLGGDRGGARVSGGARLS